MTNANTLSILQYNMRNDWVKKMIPLLADPRTQDYNIIAVQESWQNPNAPTTLSLYQSGFHLLYRPGRDIQVCFYINTNINPSSWEIEYPLADMYTLTITVHTGITAKTINIHNTYNPSPASYTSTNSPSTIFIVVQQLRKSGKHILLGDFNLYHPFWSGPSRPTVYAAADQLLDLMENMTYLSCYFKIQWHGRHGIHTAQLI